MTIAIWVVGAYCILTTAAHIGSILIAARRCRKRRPGSARSGGKTALGVLGLTRFLRRRGLHYGKQRLGGAGAATGISRRQSGSAGLRIGKPHRGYAALG